jgi:hypothetical protein
MAETKTIDPQHAADLFDSSDGEIAGPWTRKGIQHRRTSRWEEHYWLVVADEDGATWGLPYSQGLTEIQETEWPWEKNDDDPLPLVRLFPCEVVKVEYRTETSA